MLSKPSSYPWINTKILSHCVYPYPCGWYNDPIKPCTCAPSAVTKYQKRLSGPLLDRIDIHIEVPRVGYQKLSSDWLGEVWQFCKLDGAKECLVRAAMGQMNLSARGYHRVVKLARTIADLAGSENIQAAHLAEALQYRPKTMMG